MRTLFSSTLPILGVCLLCWGACTGSNDEPAAAPPAPEPTPQTETETESKPETSTPEGSNETEPSVAAPTKVKRTPPTRVRSVDDFMKDARKEINSENYERKLDDMDRAINNLERAVNENSRKGGGGFGR